MLAGLRQGFNQAFTPEKYRDFLAQLDQACGAHVSFRICETPCFLPKQLLDKMSGYGHELVYSLVNSHEYRRAADSSIPLEFNVANETQLPMFVQVDFGLVSDQAGELQPKLVELQAFPSLYGFQPTLSQQYIESYDLRAPLKVFLSDLDQDGYWKLLRRMIVGDCDPENVVLLEIDPLQQKTLADFTVTERQLGIVTVDITQPLKKGGKLFYKKNGREIPIARIYNRCIVDELVRKKVKLTFDLRDDLDVSWAGHPNWYFRISKFSIPYLSHPSVPRTWFLDEIQQLPNDRQNYVLKPLYSFAGAGLKFAPTDADIRAIPSREIHNYILQERLHFAPVIKTPHGDTQMEVRIMYVWPEDGELMPVLTLVRMGRGKMMGVDHNRDLEWVGGSAGLWVD